MKIHILQHESSELVGPGNIVKWASKKNHQITTTRVDLNEAYPESKEFDLLIILGGFQSAYDEENYEWLEEEKRWIRVMIEKNKYVLGICLGAQLIADAMGGKAKKHIHKEIGWWPVQFNERALSHPLLKGMPKEATFYQFHQDTFQLPEMSDHLAENKASKNQAYSINEHVLALQFHPEVQVCSAKNMLKLLKIHPKEATPFIQNEAEIIKSKHFQKSEKLLYKILNNFEYQILKNN